MAPQAGFVFDGTHKQLAYAMHSIHRIHIKAREPRRNRMAWLKFFGDEHTSACQDTVELGNQPDPCSTVSHKLIKRTTFLFDIRLVDIGEGFDTPSRTRHDLW